MMQLAKWGIGMLRMDRIDSDPFLDPGRVEHLVRLIASEPFAVQRVAAPPFQIFAHAGILASPVTQNTPFCTPTAVRHWRSTAVQIGGTTRADASGHHSRSVMELAVSGRSLMGANSYGRKKKTRP
jgi:hypothetical protein